MKDEKNGAKGHEELFQLFHKKNKEFEEKVKKINLTKAQENWKFIKEIFSDPRAKEFMRKGRKMKMLSILDIIISYTGELQINMFNSMPTYENINKDNLQCVKELAELNQTIFLTMLKQRLEI